MKQRGFAASLAVACYVAAAPAAQATMYGNIAAGSYYGAFGPFGLSDSTAIGEEFTAPGNTGQSVSLQSWAFYLSSISPAGSTFNVDFVLASWNASAQTSGAPLYSAAGLVSGATGQALTWSNINQSLTPGSDYIAYLNVVDASSSGAAFNLQTAPANGGLADTLYYNTSTTSPWSGFFNTPLAFSASMTATTVPEPASTAGLGAGLVGLWLIRRRRHA